MADELNGRKVAILLAPAGTEQVEFTEPKKAVESAGADVDVIGIQTGEAKTMNNDTEPGETFIVEKTFSDVSPSDYDSLIVPGGTVGADTLRGNDEAVGTSSGGPTTSCRSSPATVIRSASRASRRIGCRSTRGRAGMRYSRRSRTAR